MPKEQLRDGDALEPQFRVFDIGGKSAIDEDARTVDISFSSEEPVARWFGREVLDHSPESADLTRLNDGGAVLFEHDPREQIGVVERASIDDDKVGRARIRFSKSARAQEIFQDIVDGIRSKISFGYRILEAEVTERNKELGDLYRVMSWQALEISSVSIPADATVGVGRSEDLHSHGTGAPVLIASETKTKKKKNMDTNEAAPAASEQVRAAAPVASEPKIDVEALRKEERERIREINAIGSRFGLDDSQISAAVAEGTKLDEFRKHVTDNFKPAPAAPTGPSHEIGLGEKEKRSFSIRKALLELRSGRGLSGLEAEVSNATADALDLERSMYSVHLPLDILEAKRDLEAGTTTEGGHTIQTDIGSMIETLRNRMTVVDAGATLLSGLRGNVALPKGAAASASWVDEEGSVTETAQSFSQVTLSPQRLSARTVYSDLLIKQSTIAIENFVRDDLMKVIAIELDRTALQGSGVAPEPIGVENQSGVNTVTFGAAATYAKILDFEELIETDNASGENMHWITTPAVRAAWKAISKDTGSGQFLWDDDMVLGYAAHVTNQITGNLAFFGDFSQLLIGSFGSQTVTVDPYSKAQTGQFVTTISGFYDIAVRHGEAFAVSTDSGAQ